VADGLHVVQRCGFESERLCAVDAATAAVAHRRPFYSAFAFGMAGAWRYPVLALPAGTARKAVRVDVPWRATES
jgi:hypothetical protein